ncbi:hypothetical protein TRAPUB_13568 [Trametes pubescens]|uniref:Uncharacterized protein n=1 Tax=Trametes pubescens TaxID=154538 RepID=A0A1M2VQP6_TRAPU|nr:hypothetical protein TRAPUB_13568 [Trametes pubescens]
MRPHTPRSDTYIGGDSSPLPDQCTPISASVKLCPVDAIAIAAVAVFICYIVWGIPPTVRATRAFYARCSQRKKKRDIRVHLADDLEKGTEDMDDSDPSSKPTDPYLGPTKLLRSFLLNGKVALPERAYKSHGQETAETRKEREMLGRFRFPHTSPTPSSPTFSPTILQSPYEPTISGAYHVPLVTNAFDRDEPLSPYSASFPAPPGLASTSAQVELGSPSLDVADRLDPLPPMPPAAGLSPFADGEEAKPIEWTPEQEKILWDVIAKSRAIEGAGTDWKGLADHLRVPLPYLLYRAQARYEEDLRRLQGLAIRIPSTASPAVPSPQRDNTQGEYFPRVSDPALPQLLRRDSTQTRRGSSSSATGELTSASGTVPGTSTLRPLGVRARLSSLGHARAHGQLKSPLNTEPVHSPLIGPPATSADPSLSQAKKILSSSTITLPGPRRTHTSLRRLSSASSRAASSEGGSESDSEDSDEQTRKEEEAERQDMLTRKLQNLQNMMTKDTLGLVADPARTRAKQRGKARPTSGTSTSAASLSSSSARQSSSPSRSYGHESLSSASVDSRQGSVPSIAPATHSSSRSPARATPPMPVPRHLSIPSSSPPALSPGRAMAVGQTRVQTFRPATAGLAVVSGAVSEASSFSDLSGEILVLSLGSLSDK